MRQLTFSMVRIAAVLLLGGFMGATLVRVAPGFGTDEQELDSRLNYQSQQALRQTNSNQTNIASYYLHYLSQLSHGDMGYSKTLQAPIRELLVERLPETMKSVGLGLLFGWTLGLILGAAPTLLRNSFVDLFNSVLAGVVLAVPAAVLALLFVMARAPGRLVLGLIIFPKVFRYTRNLLSQSAAQPHVITAWAKGLGSFRVLLRHILPTSAPQLLALAGVTVSLAFAAAIPVEVVCDLPGIGQLAWKAALGRDMGLLVTLTMVVTAVTLAVNSVAGWMAAGLTARNA
jgi:peptide/nickel transport system permease protein